VGGERHLRRLSKQDDVPLPFRKFEEDGSHAMSPAAAISGSGGAAACA